MNSLIKYLGQHDISKETLSAMKKTDRKKFIPEEQIQSRKRAYEDTALFIGHNVTISQPSLVGKMIDLLHINDILELETGLAYNAVNSYHMEV